MQTGIKGKIIKGIAGFYYVYVPKAGLYECKAKGSFRKAKIKPLVGDDVLIAVIDEAEKKGNIEEILPRTKELIRPAVSNIDMALVVFAAAKPDPNFNLLDRFLCMMEFQKVPVTICFNKCDLVSEETMAHLRSIYEPAGYEILFISVREKLGLEKIHEALKGRTTTVAGPSGVGKSSLINSLQTEITMETGAISEKIERGKNTTRHAQIVPIAEDTFIMDTPGFSSMDLPEVEKDALWECYPEFREYEPYCRFQGCSHLHEPDCGVRDAVQAGRIPGERYENYRLLYTELKNMRKY